MKSYPFRGRLEAVLLLLLMLAWSRLLGEQLETVEPLFLDGDSRGLLQTHSTSFPGIGRLAVLNPRALGRLESATNPRFYSLEVFGKQRLLRIVSRNVFGDVRSFSIAVEGEPDSRLLLVQKRDLLAGSGFFAEDGSIQLSPVADHLCEIKELDASIPPLCATGQSTESSPRMVKQTLPATQPSGVEIPDQPTDPVPTEKEREIELMILYTPRTKAGAFGAETLELSIHVALAEANLAFQNSRTGVQLRLVHMAEIAYAESGDLSVDLRRLQSPNDGYLDEVHPWRDTYQADLICLIVDRANRYVGMALYPTGPEGGFSVLDRFHLTGSGLMAHELGHNFGCDHDRENAVGSGQFDFSFGHRFDVEGQVYRTVMCYSPGWPIAIFSNPSLSYKGVPTGLEEGEVGQADNARTIRQMAAFVDRYRGVTASMSSPVDGMLVTEGEPIELAVSVESTEGPVQRVEFFADGSLLGQLSNDAAAFFWTNATPGKHVLSARVTVAEEFSQSTDAITVGIRPKNDDFFNRQQLDGTNLVIATVLFAAGAEPGEPAHFGAARHSVWWTWTAPIPGIVRVAASSSAWAQPKVAVYVGDDLPQLQLVAKADAPLKDAFFMAEAGERYQIVVDGATAEIPVSLYLTMHQTPVNDQFADAQLVGSALRIQGTTLAGTREPGEPQIGTGSYGHSIWFCWTPSVSGTAEMTVDSNQTDPFIDFAVFVGDDLPSLKLIANSTQARQRFQVTGRVPYWIGVDGPYGNVAINLRLSLPPLNDNFARKMALNSSYGVLQVNNYAATREQGEPVHGAIRGGHSQWWSWRSQSNGAIRFTRTRTVRDSTPPLALAIYTGTALTNLVLQAAHDFINSLPFPGLFVREVSDQISSFETADSAPQENLVFPVIGGTNYFIAVDGQPASETPQLIQLEWMQRPNNDHFRQRQAVIAVPRSVSGTTFGATSEPDEPFHGGRPARHSVWWSWNFRTNGLVAATVDGSGSTLPFLSVYRGTHLTNLVLVADNSSGASLGATVVFSAQTGGPHHIAIDEAASSFTFTLGVQYVSRPGNDDFANRTKLPGSLGDILGSTVGASSEAEEPEHSQTASGRSVWYTWTARGPGFNSVLASGRRQITTGALVSSSRAALPPPLVAVYAGTSLVELEQVASGLGAAHFYAERDVPYQIAVDGADGQCGDFSLNIVGVPRNDNFQNATPLSEPPAWMNTSPAFLWSATREPGEPTHAGSSSGRSLWWTWTPRQSGAYVLEDMTSYTLPSSTPARVVKAVYTGATLAELVVVASNRWGNLPFTGTAGTRHYLALDLEDSTVAPQSLSRGQVSINLVRAAKFLMPKIRKDATVEFTVAGSTGRTILLQRSTDLIDWELDRTVVLPGTSYRFFEPRLSSTPQKFYRAVPAP